MKRLKIYCRRCGGTGLYRGFDEPEGVAVICLGCDGSGAEELRVEEFVSRKPSRGIVTVLRSAGSFIATGVGEVSYEAFSRGEKPTV